MQNSQQPRCLNFMDWCNKCLASVQILTPLLAEELLDGLARGKSVGSCKDAIEASIVVNVWAGDSAASLTSKQRMSLHIPLNSVVSLSEDTIALQE